MRGVKYWLNMKLPSGNSTYAGVSMAQAQFLTASALEAHYPEQRHSISRHVLYNLLHHNKQRRARKNLASIATMRKKKNDLKE